MTEIFAKNKHLLMELARASLAVRHAAGPKERQGMEDLCVYLSLELEKRSRYNHYYEKEHPAHWWQRAAAQFRIGRKVANEMVAGRENPEWVKECVERWVEEALAYYEKHHLVKTAKSQ